MKMQKADLKLDWCNYKLAKYACENWHYSRSIPTPPYNMIGVWENGKYVGCIIFSRGANKDLGKPFGLKQIEVCELSRVALNNHVNTVTKMISIAIKLLLKRSPGIKLIISFADKNQNHEGVIYKAGNWIYLGKTSKSFLYIDENGKKYHPRQVSPTGLKIQYGNIRKVPTPDSLNRIEQLPKYRFAYPVTKSMRQELESKAADSQSEKGGAVPTLAHHKGVI